MSNLPSPATEQRFILLAEIEQIPDDRIPELLKITRLLRQSAIVDRSSPNARYKAMEQINNVEQGTTNLENIQKLFQEWTELDEEEEQGETLKIIESLEGISI